MKCFKGLLTLIMTLLNIPLKFQVLGSQEYQLFSGVRRKGYFAAIQLNLEEYLLVKGLKWLYQGRSKLARFNKPANETFFYKALKWLYQFPRTLILQ